MEFQPEKKKKPLILDELNNTNNSLEIIGNSSLQQPNQSPPRTRFPVEIIGIQQRPTTANSRSLYEIRSTNTTASGERVAGGRYPTPSNLLIDEEDEGRERIDRPKLVKWKKSSMTSQHRANRLGEALDDGVNYNRIIDTLSDRLLINNPNLGPSSSINRANNNNATNKPGKTNNVLEKNLKATNMSVKSLEKRLVGLIKTDDSESTVSTSNLSNSMNRNR